MEKVEEVIEGQADWNALEASIEKPAPLDGAESAPEVDPVAEAEAMFGFVVATLAGMAPFVEQWYPPERVRKIAETYVPLADRRGWDTWGWLEKYGLELAFIGAVLPPQAIKIAIEAAKAKFFPAPKVQGPQEPVPGALVAEPGQNTVTFG